MQLWVCSPERGLEALTPGKAFQTTEHYQLQVDKEMLGEKLKEVKSLRPGNKGRQGFMAQSPGWSGLHGVPSRSHQGVNSGPGQGSSSKLEPMCKAGNWVKNQPLQSRWSGSVVER